MVRAPARGCRHEVPMSVCRAVERELYRLPSLRGRTLQCGPELQTFAAAHASVGLRELFAGGPVTLGLLRALLDGGSAPALAAALDWLGLRPGAWLDAQRAWEASRQYEGELSNLPATTWPDFRTAVFRRALEAFSRETETGIVAACEDAGIMWTTDGWEVISRDAQDWSQRASFLPSVAWRADGPVDRLVDSLSAR